MQADRICIRISRPGQIPEMYTLEGMELEGFGGVEGVILHAADLQRDSSTCDVELQVWYGRARIVLDLWT